MKVIKVANSIRGAKMERLHADGLTYFDATSMALNLNSYGGEEWRYVVKPDDYEVEELMPA